MSSKQVDKKSFNIDDIRNDFPFFRKNTDLVFLDTAASAQKPSSMIEAIAHTSECEYANVHRGAYTLSNMVTTKFENVRKKTAEFINAHSSKEIVFTKNATEAINLVATSYGESFLSQKNEIIITEAEHHANIVPWQRICKKTGAKLKIAPINDQGEIILEKYKALLSENTAVVAITHVSNVLGSIFPIKEMIQMAHNVGAKVLIDACQSVIHLDIDVVDLNCDFLVFSAHKLYGPNGIGILYGKYNLLDQMPPYQTGGAMVEEVTFQNATFQPPPLKFEAGTPCIAEIIGFGATLDYLDKIDRHKALAYENELLNYAVYGIQKLSNFKIIGHTKNKLGIISFLHKTAHTADIGYVLNNCNVAIRTGHHCALPLIKRLGLQSTARASLGIYNNYEDIEAFLAALHKLDKLFN